MYFLFWLTISVLFSLTWKINPFQVRQQLLHLTSLMHNQLQSVKISLHKTHLFIECHEINLQATTWEKNRGEQQMCTEFCVEISWKRKSWKKEGTIERWCACGSYGGSVLALDKQSLSLCFSERNVTADKQLPILSTSLQSAQSGIMTETYR